MNISFLDFWGGFNHNNNFFIHLFRDIVEDVNVTTPDKADIIIFSCFGNLNKSFTHCKKIFFTGENLRPDFSQCDYSFSFDFDSYNNRNIRIPLWYLYIDWFGVKTYDNPNWLIPVSYLNGDNEFKEKVKEKFACTVFSSPRKSRFAAIQTINSYKNIDCIGKIHSLKLPDGERFKMNVISGYKFNLCFENSIYPGYFTEKILHAKIAGCIPLYASDKTYTNDFNCSCCLNLIDYNNLNDFLKDIKAIDKDDSLYKKILNEPLFLELPNLISIKSQIYNIL